jgi:membrane fusion protein, multidrug efflux system
MCGSSRGRVLLERIREPRAPGRHAGKRVARRLKPKTIVTLLALAVLALWLLTGREAAPPAETAKPRERAPMRVAVSVATAQPVEQTLTLQGSLEPGTVTLIRAEIAGLVEALAVERGAPVKKGQLIARLAIDDREARLRRAEATLAQARRQLTAFQKLAKEGFMPVQKVDAARAELRAAEAEFKTARLELDRTAIRTTVSGILNERRIEQGEWVAVGEPIAEIVQNDPIKAVVQVPQRHVKRVRPGGEGHVRIPGAAPRTGRITFVDAVANAATRTFRVEIELPNPAGELPSGVSVQVEIPTATVLAHKISPALLRLSDAGTVGVMTVDERDIARFHAVEVVRSDADGMWVTGIPERARLITAGQHFAREGEPVLPVEDPAAAARLEPTQ